MVNEIVAILLMESSMNSIGILRDVYHQRFPENAEEDYNLMRSLILCKLGIE